MKKLSVPVTEQDHVQGAPEAKVTLVEYGDFQCPHCRIAHSVVKRVQRHFGKQLRFVYRNFPLTEIHPMAEPAAEAAEFAAGKRKFWEMHDAIFENQSTLQPELLVELAEERGLDGDGMRAAMEEGRFAAKIESEVQGGERSGVHGTPTFFINGQPHEGSFQFEDLKGAIEAV